MAPPLIISFGVIHRAHGAAGGKEGVQSGGRSPDREWKTSGPEADCRSRSMVAHAGGGSLGGREVGTAAPVTAISGGGDARTQPRDPTWVAASSCRPDDVGRTRRVGRAMGNGTVNDVGERGDDGPVVRDRGIRHRVAVAGAAPGAEETQQAGSPEIE